MNQDPTGRSGLRAYMASTGSAGVAGSGGAVWDGGTTADGRARGIDTGGGADTVRNDGRVEAIADTESASAAVSVAIAGVGVSVATSTGKADATGIDVSEGDGVHLRMMFETFQRLRQQFGEFRVRQLRADGCQQAPGEFI